jgi:hypothetical protein
MKKINLVIMILLCFGLALSADIQGKWKIESMYLAENLIFHNNTVGVIVDLETGLSMHVGNYKLIDKNLIKFNIYESVFYVNYYEFSTQLNDGIGKYVIYNNLNGWKMVEIPLKFILRRIE